MIQHEADLRQFFQQAAPFRYLSPELRERTIRRIRIESCPTGQVLLERDAGCDAVVVILAGTCTVEGNPLQQLGPGQYFGDIEILFETPAPARVVASNDIVVARLPGSDFLSLPRLSVAFAQSLAVILRDRRGIFSAFDRYRTEVLRGAGLGFLNIAKLLDPYRDLQPVLHRYANDRTRTDSAALEYAVRRLPENISSTFAFLLRDELPAAFKNPDALFRLVETAARRRRIWELLPGKNLVMLRHGDSDLMDLISCLCIYAVEARKIRWRIYGSGGISQLRAFIENAGGVKGDSASGVERDGGDAREQQQAPEQTPREQSLQHVQEDAREQALRDLLARLGFADSEIDGLFGIWCSPAELARRLYEITLHREMFAIDIRRQKDNYNSRRSEAWSQQITSALFELLDLDPETADLPADLKVHVVSSNTHSVINCLNPWYRTNAARVLEWARASGQPALNYTWKNREDELYSLIRNYFRAHPEEEAASREAGRAAGILTLAATPATGIQVQLVDSAKLAPDLLDSGLPAPPEERVIVVNIDYAFGEQAESIIRNLMLIFGRRVQSVNFLGKAGALLGERGDILIPSSFIEQSSDTVRPVETVRGRTEVRPATLAPYIEASRIHFGPMLTVEGTILQNRQMLKFYQAIWNTLGLEMEGFYYQKQVDEAVTIGMANPRLRQRYYYYVSDLPLEDGKSLSQPLHPEEGIPPLYAITRAVLSEIFRFPVV